MTTAEQEKERVLKATAFIDSIADQQRTELWAHCAFPAEILESYSGGQPIKQIGVYRKHAKLKHYNIPSDLINDPIVKGHTVGMALPCTSGWVIKCAEDCVVILLLDHDRVIKLRPVNFGEDGVGFDHSDVPDEELVNKDIWRLTKAEFSELKAADMVESLFQDLVRCRNTKPNTTKAVNDYALTKALLN